MYKQSKQLNNKIWLEASTERSESNPGRSLGIYKHEESSCLEDSTYTFVSEKKYELYDRKSISCESIAFLI